jgi:isoleucyl-tRNA synthetase
LEIFCPVSPQGTYTDGIQPAELVGMSVRDAQGWVIKTLMHAGTLVHKGSIKHSYPHCWRCRQGLIFRATPQWFIDLGHDNMQEKALAAIDTIAFYPKNSRNFLKATVDSRWEWCISRQRVWGVPIPALICNTCDRAIMSEPLVHAVAQGIEHDGVEFWERISVASLLNFVPDTDPCKQHVVRKEQDILDVWFDSGVSHTAVLRPDGQFPADLYIEGVDQHRGWFQSSLLTSMALYQKPPMKGIFSHGYTVDEKGRKMSKSLGNVIAPEEIVKQLGTDGLRLWAASISHEGDLVVSQKVLTNVAEVYRKIRNTCRFLLQNLYDFNPSKNRVPYDKLGLLDQYAYMRCAQVQAEVINAYQELDTTQVCQLLAEYCTHDLSAHYLDMVKDRLYTDSADSHRRRSAQTVMEQMLHMMVGAMAPVLSFTAELIYDLMPEKSEQSVHLTTFWSPDASGKIYDQVAWAALWKLRDAVLRSLEGLRAQGAIKASLEGRINLTIVPSLYADYEVVKNYLAPEFLREFFIVSQVGVTVVGRDSNSSEIPGVLIQAEHAHGTKCPRCWQWYTQVDEDGLCDRCHAAVHAGGA